MQTDGAKVSVAAASRAAARSQNSTKFPAALVALQLGWGGVGGRGGAGAGNSWAWTPPRSQLAGPAPLEAPSLVSVGLISS